MSAQESSRARRSGDVARFSRWPYLGALVLGIVLGPLAALINEEVIYAATMWECGQGLHAALHAIPVLCLSVVLGAGFKSYRAWRTVGAGAEDESEAVDTRTRFLAMLGVAASVLSALVILTQWLAIAMFDSCSRT